MRLFNTLYVVYAFV